MEIVPEILLLNGKMFNFAEPDPASFEIDVLAKALSHQCRFGGHVRRFYSVAEHCVRGSYLCEDPLSFLLHDAVEGLGLPDFVNPLKVLLGDVFKQVEGRIHDVIDAKYGVDTRSAEVKRVDLIMLATEKQDLQPEGPYEWAILKGVEPLKGLELAACSGRPDTWEKRYVERFLELTGGVA